MYVLLFRWLSLNIIPLKKFKDGFIQYVYVTWKELRLGFGSTYKTLSGTELKSPRLTSTDVPGVFTDH